MGFMHCISSTLGELEGGKINYSNTIQGHPAAPLVFKKKTVDREHYEGGTKKKGKKYKIQAQSLRCLFCFLVVKANEL
jgi:hypothetical protein